MKSKNFLPMLCGVAANVIFGFSFLFSKTALSTGIHPTVILAIRFFVSFLVMNILILIGAVKVSFKNKPIGKILLMAVFQPVLYFVFELYGLKEVGSAVSGVILALVPVLVCVMSAVFLKEKPTVTQTVFTIISFLCVGCISIISESGSGFSLLGLLLLILAVVCAAAFNILSRSTAGRFSAAERTYIMFAVGFLVFAVLPFFTIGNGYFGEIAKAVVSPNIIISIIYLSVLSSVVAFLMYNYCTGKIGVVKASSYSNIITVISVPAGIIFLKEEVSFPVLILCVIIMFCVYMVNKISNKG